MGGGLWSLICLLSVDHTHLIPICPFTVLSKLKLIYMYRITLLYLLNVSGSHTYLPISSPCGLCNCKDWKTPTDWWIGGGDDVCELNSLGYRQLVHPNCEEQHSLICLTYSKWRSPNPLHMYLCTQLHLDWDCIHLGMCLVTYHWCLGIFPGASI